MPWFSIRKRQVSHEVAHKLLCIVGLVCIGWFDSYLVQSPSLLSILILTIFLIIEAWSKSGSKVIKKIMLNTTESKTLLEGFLVLKHIIM